MHDDTTPDPPHPPGRGHRQCEDADFGTGVPTDHAGRSYRPGSTTTAGNAGTRLDAGRPREATR